MYALSAAAQQLFGYRLLAEAIVVGVAVGLAALLAGRLVHRLTGSLASACLIQALILLAAPRPYAYPKLIIYAVAASLWWAYVMRPTLARACALGAWTAVAFYFRPDHGVYLALGVTLGGLAASSFTWTTWWNLVAAGAVCVGLIAPWLVFAQGTVGLRAYLSGGLAQGVAEQTETSGHNLPRWPVRSLKDVLRFAPAEAFAPVVGLRWARGADQAARRQLLERYQLAAEGEDGDVTRVRVSRTAASHIPDLLRESLIEDTAGIDRAASELSTSGWPWWQRLAFRYAPFRLRILPALDQQQAGSAAATILFQSIPMLALATAILWRRRLTGIVTAGPLIAFAATALVINAGLIRTPYEVRTVDAVVFPGLIATFGVAALQEMARTHRGLGRATAVAAIAVVVILLMKSVASAGEFGERASYMAGEWRDAEHVRGAWEEIRTRLAASPPLAAYQGVAGPAEVQLARYARDCVPPTERLMVLWYAPEIYYYSDRLMAQRHLIFYRGWAALGDEQRLTLEKAQRSAAPLVFASAPRLDSVTRQAYPSLVDYVHANYVQVGSVAGDEEFVILARRDRPPARTYGDAKWPCYAHHS
jgi:hypothetical protein